MKKIYIAGPMRGRKFYNFPAFDEWQPSWATATIENNGTVEELAAKVKRLME